MEELRSPATVDNLHIVDRAASTLTTIVVPSRTNKETLVPSEAPRCGGLNNQGNFTHNFDDLPPQNANPADNPEPMPILIPYHRFYYSGGFTVLPPPAARFKPASGNLMLQFTPPSISNNSQAGMPPDTADISVEPQRLASCFSFNFTRVSLGCDSKQKSCSFTFTGLKYDRSKAASVEVASQTFIIPACPEAKNCMLTPISVSGFNGLTSINIKAELDGNPIIWWADDFAFGWFENTCESGLCRSGVPSGITRPNWGVTGRRAVAKLMDLIGVRGW
ncbi:hypothetical protein O1611_g8470 [Lasiodiplodia mahajangana]|uniref:Uncharacterized protein n=1 Tax=Lasiodiplodia mahajangana TaxID=1108764 RepID=A0ACC2JCP1_9PEZI|nr:hypothetical protein O1611_g8470 [Lasiodiplodia mahajangana]